MLESFQVGWETNPCRGDSYCPKCFFTHPVVNFNQQVLTSVNSEEFVLPFVASYTCLHCEAQRLIKNSLRGFFQTKGF